MASLASRKHSSATGNPQYTAACSRTSPISSGKAPLLMAPRTCGFGAELAALVQKECFLHLEAPIARVTGWDTPYPHAQEWAYFPGPDRVGRAFREALEAW